MEIFIKAGLPIRKAGNFRKVGYLIKPGHVRLTTEISSDHCNLRPSYFRAENSEKFIKWKAKEYDDLDDVVALYLHRERDTSELVPYLSR